jgi:hypothetical protein
LMYVQTPPCICDFLSSRTILNPLMDTTSSWMQSFSQLEVPIVQVFSDFSVVK